MVLLRVKTQRKVKPVEQCHLCDESAAVALYRGKESALLLCVRCFGGMWEELDKSATSYSVVPLLFAAFIQVHGRLAAAVEQALTEARMNVWRDRTGGGS